MTVALSDAGFTNKYSNCHDKRRHVNVVAHSNNQVRLIDTTRHDTTLIYTVLRTTHPLM